MKLQNKKMLLKERAKLKMLQAQFDQACSWMVVQATKPADKVFDFF